MSKQQLVTSETSDKIIAEVDDDTDPQLRLASDVYEHLRATEAKKRPRTDYLEKVQKHINADTRTELIDGLVDFAVEYNLVPDTLYLAVNYMDMYLSGNNLSTIRFQLLGATCMMIAAKYEQDDTAPPVEEYCYMTDEAYVKDEFLRMEYDVLSFLKFELTVPTTKCFLRRFVHAARGLTGNKDNDEAPTSFRMRMLECMADYIGELSLLEYSMLRYAPSLAAASAVFLAKFIFDPSSRPWNPTLGQYTLYQPSDLRECVTALHSLVRNPSGRAIARKYRHHRFKSVAKKYCPPLIPQEYFQ